MNDFIEKVVRPSKEAAAEIARLGGLPEITEAASGLRVALDQTREEIESAVFAPRFLATADRNILEAGSGVSLSLTTRLAAERDGEAGIKREQLGYELAGIEADITSALHRLIELRADLAISQTEI